MTRQLPLDLGHTPSYSEADYLVSASNAAAWSWVGQWPNWPGRGLALCGPPGCGKTHLAHIWQARASGVAVEAATLAGLDPMQALGESVGCVVDGAGGGELTAGAQRALLHLYNVISERRGHMLICAETAPARWPVALPDLRSRLAALPAVAIDPPGDGLLEG